MSRYASQSDFQADWYIARVAPGYSREATPRINRQGEPAQPDRIGETRIERSLRDEGFDCYLPRMRKEIRHHRTNKLIVRSFPLFVGYIFVSGLSVGSKSVNGCDGVTTIMGKSLDGKPWPVPASAVMGFQQQEDNLEFDDTHEARVRRRQEGRTRKETIRMQFPTGQKVRVSDGVNHPFAGFHGDVVSVTGRGTVKAMISILGGLVPIDIPASDIEVVVSERKVA